jgi:hypothetical protein
MRNAVFGQCFEHFRTILLIFILEDSNNQKAVINTLPIQIENYEDELYYKSCNKKIFQ